MTKVFIIGFNKCGTTALDEFFKRNAFKTVHCRLPTALPLRATNKYRNLAWRMFRNLMHGRSILRGFDDYEVYSDMIYASEDVILEANSLYPKISEEWPEAFWILNTRPIDSWLQSRLRHKSGDFVRRCQIAWGLSASDVVARWETQWRQHHTEVRAFFNGNSRFCEFDIERDPITQVTKMLEPQLHFNCLRWKAANETWKKDPDS